MLQRRHPEADNTLYPAHNPVDRILKNLVEDFFHDEVHALCDGSDEPAHSLRVSQMFAKGASRDFVHVLPEYWSGIQALDS